MRHAHYFWTRIALDSAAINAKLTPRSPETHERMIHLWRGSSSLFYEAQTEDAPFKVMLAYSPSNEELVRSFEWPRWAELTTETTYDWWAKNAPVGKAASFHRVDADDSYAIDLFEHLHALDYPARTHLLYPWNRQYDLQTCRLFQPVKSRAPQFSGIYWPEVPPVAHLMDGPASERIAHVYGVEGNHGNYGNSPHVDVEGCYALMRITGFNAVNRLGSVMKGGGVPMTQELKPDPRFIL